ncbi:MAG: hypothetical protein V1827_04230 [Candidatus Micrarchaeota archaeon]
MRAFIFSLDAFVAFTLALLAIYSLIFFSSIPSAYYYLLTQAHYLSRDSLLALSTAPCSSAYDSCVTHGSVLDNIVVLDEASRTSLIQKTVGAMVPPQFGYSMEMSDDDGVNWELLYDTADPGNAGDPHENRTRKLTVSTQVMVFGFEGKVSKLETSPYRYNTCEGAGVVGGDEWGAGTGQGGYGYEVWDFALITCGVLPGSGGGGGGGSGSGAIIGNTHPRYILSNGDDLVPASDARIVKLTVFI